MTHPHSDTVESAKPGSDELEAQSGVVAADSLAERILVGEGRIGGNWQGDLTPFGEALFPAMPPVTQVSYVVPDGRWQRFKHWLKQHRLLPKWVKVRYVKYSFDAALSAEAIEDEEGAGFTVKGHAVGPIEKGLEER